MSERVLRKMAYRAEPEGVLAVVEAPRREPVHGDMGAIAPALAYAADQT